MESRLVADGILNETNDFVDVIRNTETYKEYVIQKEKVKKIPGLKAQIDEYRARNFKLQNGFEGDNLMQELDRLQKENEEMLSNPLVTDFLDAELAFCRLMQDVNVYITEQMDFE